MADSKGLDRRAFFRGLGASTVGAATSWVALQSVVSITGIANLDQQQGDQAAGPVQDRTSFRYVPVLIAPSDITVTPAHLDRVQAIIDSGNTKLFAAAGFHLRIDSRIRVVKTAETNAELKAKNAHVSTHLLDSMSKSLPEFSKPGNTKFVGFYIGDGSSALRDDHWLGVAIGGTAALVLADPLNVRGSEDRVFVHESFHLMGFTHVSTKVVQGDVMNPAASDGNRPVFVGDYLRDFNAPGDIQPLIRQKYICPPPEQEHSVQALFRKVGREKLGNPLTGLRPRYDGGGYFQLFENGALTWQEKYGAIAITDFYPQWSLLEHGFPVTTQRRETSLSYQNFEYDYLKIADPGLPLIGHPTEGPSLF